MKPEDIMENEDEVMVITLEDDDGNETEFEVIGDLSYGDDQYMALITTDDEGEVAFVKYLPTEDDDEGTFETVTDAKLNEELFEALKTEYAEYFDFED